MFKLKRMTLKNFGSHRDVTFSDFGVFHGILGRNGQGKSTFLTALKYLFDGKFDAGRTGNSWVSYGEKSGYVEGEFDFHSKTYVLRREIKNSGSGTKSITIDGGDTITGASEVERVLTGLFGADKQAVSSCKFIRQGMIKDVLFSKDATRIETMLKLFNLIGVVNQADIVARFAEQKASSIVDHSESIANFNLQRTSHREDLKKTEDQLNALNFSEDTFTTMELLEKKQSSLPLKKDDLQRTRAKLIPLEKVRDTNEEFVAKSAEYGDKVDGLVSDIEKERKFLELLRWWIPLERTRRDLREKREKIETDLNNLVLSGSDIERSQTLATTLNLLNEYWSRDKEVKDIQDEVTALESTWAPMWDRVTDSLGYVPEGNDAGVSDLLAASPDIQSWDREISLLTSLIENLKFRIDTFESIKEHGLCTKEEGRCKVCGLQLDENQVVDPQRLANLNHELEQHETDLKDFKARKEAKIAETARAHESFKVVYDRYKTRSSVLRDTRDKLTGTQHALSDMGADPDTADYEALKSEHEALETRLKEHKDLTRDLALYDDTYIPNNERDILKFKEQDGAQPIMELDKDLEVLRKDTESAIQGIQDSLDYFNAKLVELKPLVSEYNQAVTLIAEHKNTIEELGQTISNLETSIDTEGKVLLDWGASHIENFSGKLEQVFLTLKDNKNVYYQLTGTKNSLLAQLKHINSELERLTELQKQGSLERQVVEEFRMVAGFLGKDGIPGEFLDQNFSMVSEVTCDLLERMGANFTVKPDPERRLNFLFHKYEVHEEGVWPPMQHMSGGEEIVLSVAYILAVNEIIFPDFPFICFDEPSVHLDYVNIQNMANIFLDLEAMFEKISGQIMAIDHREEILKTIKSQTVL